MAQSRLTLVLSTLTLVSASPKLSRAPSTLCQCWAGLYTPTRSLPRYHCMKFRKMKPEEFKEDLNVISVSMKVANTVYLQNDEIL